MTKEDKAKVGRRDFCAPWAPARAPQPPGRQSPTSATADSETNDEKRKARYRGNRAREDLLSGQQISNQALREARPCLSRKANVKHVAARLLRRLQVKRAALDRRTFLRRSGLAAGGLAALGALPLGGVRKAEAAGRAGAGQRASSGRTSARTARSAARCWPRSRTACGSARSRAGTARSTAARIAPRAPPRARLTHGDRRLRYPMKMVGGQWQRISWDTAINEIGDKLLQIREKSGPNSVYWLGSAKFTNEAAYLNRKFAAFWGTNNSDHQARICHSTTVAGVANTWGYGAMTNSYNDIRNAKTMVIMGGNPAEAHPVSLQHVLEGKELNRANIIVIDPRLTRTAAHATEYVRLRSGTDIPVIWGMLWHIFKNGWEDKEFIAQRVYGMDEIRKEVDKWTPEEVERVSGVPGAQLERVAKMFATEKPVLPDLGMGADPAHGRHGQSACVLHRCCWPPAMSASSARAPTSSAATPTCRAPPILASIS